MQEMVKAILHLSGELKEVKVQIERLMKSRDDQFNESWMDGQEVMQTLNISKRALQTLRDKGEIPFTSLRKKYYYKVCDVKALLESHYSRIHSRQSHD